MLVGTTKIMFKSLVPARVATLYGDYHYKLLKTKIFEYIKINNKKSCQSGGLH